MSGLKVYWNGEEIDVEGCENYIREMGRKLLERVFALYKKLVIQKNKTPIQKLVAAYDKPRVSNPSNDGQTVFKQIDNKVDAERFVEYVEDCLRRLPGLYQKIIIDSYVRGIQEPSNYMALELPRSTYYYMKADAVRFLVNEFVARGIEKAVRG